MSIEFLCPDSGCRTKLEVGDKLAGKKVRCPKCKVVMVVPRGESVGDGSRTAKDAKDAERKGEGVGEEGSDGVVESRSDGGRETQAGGVELLDAFLSQRRGQVEPFEVERELAHGGMGAVIPARDKAIQRELAVKVMRPQIADSEEHRLRFLEEAQVTGQLEHPNIVPIHDLGKDAEGNLYFTMKLVKGKSLGEILTELKDEEVSRKGAKAQRREGMKHRKVVPLVPPPNVQKLCP